MKNCTHCKHAEWERNARGHLHPTGVGRCTYPYRIPELPASMYWISNPAPSGGYINRRKEMERHCPYFAYTQVEERIRGRVTG